MSVKKANSMVRIAPLASRTAFSIAGLTSLALCVVLASPLPAAAYPDRSVKVIVPFPAGGVTDIATRLIAQKLSERLKQQFYIENIGGAGGKLGMANAGHAPREGVTPP